MNPIEAAGQDIEADWDSFVISRCDFRPQWEGDLINLFTVVDLQGSEAETEAFMISCARSISQWVVEHKDQFGAEDRYQIVIGWPKTVRRTGRQTIKTGGTLKHLKSLVDGTIEIEMRRGWTYSVFPRIDQANKPKQGDPSQRPC